MNRRRWAWLPIIPLSLLGAACGSNNESVQINHEAATLFEATGLGAVDLESSFHDYETAVAACMANSGFEYIPEQYVQPGEVAAPMEVVSEHGYGVVSHFLATAYGGTDPTDNQAYVSSLGAAERDAYFIALNGSSALEAGGCRLEVTSVLSEAEVVFFEELPRMQEAVATRVQASPEFTQFRSDWQRCFADKGHQYANSQQAAAAIQNTLFELLANQPLKPEASNMTREEIAAAGFEATATKEAIEQLDKVRDTERNLAIDDLECVEATKGDLDQLAKDAEAEYVATMHDGDHDH